MIKIHFILISFLLTTNLCCAQTLYYCNKYNFKSFKTQADSIKLFMNRALKESSETRNKWERKFFCAFPNSYASMDVIFGYKKEHGPLCRSSNKRSQFYGSMSAHIDFFSRLKSIPDEEYYKKYVNICIDGFWQADYIRVAFGFGLHLLNNPSPSCASLAKRTDDEIISVFRFIFDGPHPNHETNKRFYKMLLPIIEAEDKRLSKLLTMAYRKLMSENHKH